MRTALITGITGQDGGYLTERLLADGEDVHGLVHRGDEHAASLAQRHPDITLHVGDLADAAGVEALLADVEPDEIYNLGGISSVALAWRQPVLTARVNGLGVAGLLESAWHLQEGRGRPVRVLQASSAEIFGAPETSPQSEETPLRPVNPYGAAKAYAHTLLRVYRSRGLYACGCILFNHESPRRPETFVTRKITAAAAAIAAGRQDVLALGNLDVRRDWGWAPDYVDAMIRAIRHSEPDDYVIASGHAHSVREFVAVAFGRVGLRRWEQHVRLDASFARPVEAAEQVGDASKARRVLGWTPSMSFEQIVTAMVDHDVALLQPAPAK
jgi:GDPmannose 4,6-dehydratase